MKYLCPTCEGKGTIPDPKFEPRPEPKGVALPPHVIAKNVKCQTCDGEGWIDRVEVVLSKCPRCKGEGIIKCGIPGQAWGGPSHASCPACKERGVLELKVEGLL